METTAMIVHAKQWSNVAPVDLALLKRMELAAMIVDAKLWSRVATVDLALPGANGNYSDDRVRQIVESCRNRRPRTP